MPVAEARNSSGAAAAWWCHTVKAGLVIRAARRHSGDIPSAARALGVALTDHTTVLARAKHAVAKVEAGMAWAQRSGVAQHNSQPLGIAVCAIAEPSSEPRSLNGALGRGESYGNAPMRRAAHGEAAGLDRLVSAGTSTPV